MIGRGVRSRIWYGVSAACAAALLVQAASACSAARGWDPETSADFTGAWILDAEASQNPPDATGPVRVGPGGGGMGRGGGGMGGRGGGIVRGGMGGSREEMQERMERFRDLMQVLTEERERLVVQRSDSILTVTYASGSEIELPTDGKNHAQLVRGVGEFEAKARWQGDGRLVLEREFDYGIKVKEEFSRGSGSPRLVVVTEVAAGFPRDITFQTVYDREATDGGPGL